MSKKDYEVIHYGPTRWEGPAEKKHYSRHATLDEANTHARKIAHKSLPKEKGWVVDHLNNAAEPDDPMHSYHHINEDKGKMGDSVYAQKRGSQEKFEKDVSKGKARLDPVIMKPLLDFAFKKKQN